MTRIARALGRTVLLAAALGARTATAWARVHVDADSAVAVRKRCRLSGCQTTHRARTTALSVALPDVTSARADLMAGWTSPLDRDTTASGP